MPTLVERKMEYKVFDFDIDIEKREIHGYAAAYSVDNYLDRIVPGAFQSTLERKFHGAITRKGSPDIRLCYQHDKKQVIGTILELKEDNKGLYMRARISETSLGNDVLTLIKDKALDCLSIGYIATKAHPEKVMEKKVRVLDEVEVFEVSIVTIPGNDDTTIDGVKSLEEGGVMEIKVTDARLQELADDCALEVKAGRKMSAANKTKLKSAMTALMELALTVDDEDKGGKCPDCGEKMDGDDCKCGYSETKKDGGSGIETEEDLQDPKRRKNPANAKSSETETEVKSGAEISPEQETQLLQRLTAMEERLDKIGKETVKA